jgi:triosephosphate isomerase (TIM)
MSKSSPERTPIIAGNWKMNPPDMDGVMDLSDGLALSSAAKVEDREVILFPPSPFIPEVYDRVDGTNIQVGGQDLHWEKVGAHTGEISGSMLKDVGCSHVLAGHSERRAAGETDKTVNAKVRAALDAALSPILCVGEVLAQRKAGEAENVVGEQVKAGLKGVTPEEMKNVVVAYEPVWAIGTGETASSKDANTMCEYIRGLVAEILDQEIADSLRILYGGSVKPGNVDELMAKEHVDGALVGGAALDADSFERIVNFE